MTGDRRIVSAPAHVSGLTLVAVAGAMAAGTVVELAVGGAQVGWLLACTLATAAVGLGLRRATTLPTRTSAPEVGLRSVGVSWLVISLAAAVPYVLTGTLAPDLALFESVSGLTGCGATVLSPIEGNSTGVLFYRQMTQWVGGMGVVVLAVAVLPFLGVGGLSLFRAESVGPTSDQLAARVSDTARRLWGIYCALTALAVLILVLCGMGPYDAVSHAATGLATGGFSPYNDSISHFDSARIEAGVQVTMFLGAVKFPLFWAAVRGRTLRPFAASSEFRTFVTLVVAATAAVTVVNRLDGTPWSSALRGASFNVVSLVSSTGFGTDDFTRWAAASQLILLFLMVSGSMAGSTSGALKLFRVQVAAKQAWREVRRVRHPIGVFPIRLGREPVPEDVVRSVLGYVMLYFVIAVGGIVTLSLLGADLPTSAGSVVTAMGGVGPGLGETGPASNFLVLDAASRAVMMLLMLLGRLEILPLLVFLVPLGGRSVRAGRRATRGIRTDPLGDPDD